MLTKVISGGQTGVDQAALAAAYKVNLEVGGYCPKGYKTQDGPRRGLLGIKYQLQEVEDDSYAVRTRLNVEHSDGTLRIARFFDSLGEICTKKAIELYNKPFLDIFHGDNSPISCDYALEVCEWIEQNNISILNVAGNSQRTAPGIYMVSRNFLWKVFMRCVGRRH